MGGAPSQKHFISMVIKVPLLLKKAARARTPTLTSSCLRAAAVLLCLSLYMLDVQSGSLRWYNQPPAEPALCSSPAAFCPLELPLHPRPLIAYVYTTFTPIRLFLLPRLFISLLFHSHGEEHMHHSLMLWQQLQRQRKRGF